MKNSKEQCEVCTVLDQFSIFFEESDGKIIGGDIADKEHK